jgi:predicted aspartyl protease
VTLETYFETSQKLIFVEGQIKGPRATMQLRLVLDTGASETLIIPEVLDEIGYRPRDGEGLTTVSSALGREHGYRLRVAELSTLGFWLRNHPVNVLDLGDSNDIHGLIGLSFLKLFDYEVRSDEGRILVSNLRPLDA